MFRFLTTILLVLFVSSGLSLPTTQKQNKNDIELFKVVQKLQTLSDASSSDTLDFAYNFGSTVTALRVVAGLQFVITQKSKNGSDASLVLITCVKLPFLPGSIAGLNFINTVSTLSIPGHFTVDTSVILPPDTPPPIV